MSDEAFRLLRNWVDLGERTMNDHAARLDANRTMDFHQGVHETKAFLDTIPTNSGEGE